MRLLTLVTDAFGGRGGIAKFNRDLLTALCEHDGCTAVVALPRVIAEEPTSLPSKLLFRAESAGGKIKYVRHVLRALATDRFDGVICGHIDLLPVAALAASVQRVPLLLVVHGVEVWQRTPSQILRIALRRVNAFVSVSALTRERFLSWARPRGSHGIVIPNCIDTQLFSAGPKSTELLSRYALGGRTVLLTVARLWASERYKGVDEVLEVLPKLIRDVPTVSYLLVGDGDDRERLEAKAEALGVRERVVFAGYVPEHEKADHFRLADAFVMPGRGEGFGIVYLEALACGIPVVASTEDASREAVLHGALGELAHPDRPEEIRESILRTLKHTRGTVPEALAYFSVENFRLRWQQVVDQVFRAKSAVDTASNAPPATGSEVRSVAKPPMRGAARAAARSRD